MKTLEQKLKVHTSNDKLTLDFKSYCGGNTLEYSHNFWNKQLKFLANKFITST